MSWTHSISSSYWVSLPETCDMCLMIMAALAIFQACICVVVDMGKLLIDLNFYKYFQPINYMECGSMITYGHLFCCSTITD
jgi:Ni/Fe-hydrogenase subunit HybB-like protein